MHKRKGPLKITPNNRTELTWTERNELEGSRFAGPAYPEYAVQFRTAHRRDEKYSPKTPRINNLTVVQISYDNVVIHYNNIITHHDKVEIKYDTPRETN